MRQLAQNSQNKNTRAGHAKFQRPRSPTDPWELLQFFTPFLRSRWPRIYKTKLRANAHRQLANNLFVHITLIVHAFPPQQVAQNSQKTNCAPQRTDNCRTKFPRILLQLLTLFLQSRWLRIFKNEFERHRTETIAEQPFRAYQYTCPGVVFEASGPESIKTKFRANARRQLGTNLFVRITIIVHAFSPKQVAQNLRKTNCAPPRTDNCRTTFPWILLQLLTLFLQSR